MQITNLYNKEGSLEDARPKSFGSEFFRTVDLGQQYDTVSHVGGIVFHSIQQSTLVYHIRRDTLHYFTKSSIILDIHFWCITFAVMHHHILPCRHTRVNSTSWDSPVRGPASITTFWFPADTRCLKHTRSHIV